MPFFSRPAKKKPVVCLGRRTSMPPSYSANFGHLPPPSEQPLPTKSNNPFESLLEETVRSHTPPSAPPLVALVELLEKPLPELTRAQCNSEEVFRRFSLERHALQQEMSAIKQSIVQFRRNYRV